MNKEELIKQEHFSMKDLEKILLILRAPDGCPWDRAQTHKSLRNHLIEESYEVCEGIDQEDDKLLCEELGDVLLQIVLHSEIAKERGAFDLDQVIDGISKKMIHRHPNVFGDVKIRDQDQKKLWDEIKKKEKGERSLSDTLSRISTALPALKRAEKILEKGKDKTLPGSVDTKDDPMLTFGETFYRTCLACLQAGVDPEEALSQYLKKTIENCSEMI